MPGRKTLIAVARFAASGLMLWLLITKIEGKASLSLPEWNAHTALWLGGAALLTLLSLVLSTLRWQTVLHALGERPRAGRLFSYYLAGQFVANVLPTTIGGDVLRVSRLSRENGAGPTSFASVVLERMSGWIVLPVITFAGLALNPGLRHLGKATTVAVSLAIATLVLLTIVLAMVASHRFAADDTTTGWRRFLGAVQFGVDRLRRKPSAAASVLFASLVYQLALVLAAIMAAKALGIADAGPTALMAFFPAVAIAQVLPISISGLGVREGLFTVFLTPLGVPTEQAVALGLLLYVLNLVVSLLGAPSFAIGHRTPPSTTVGPTPPAAAA